MAQASSLLEVSPLIPTAPTSSYHAQSHGENAFSRFKRTFGGGLREKRDEAKERGGFPGLTVAQSGAGIGLSPVLSSQLKSVECCFADIALYLEG